MEYVVIGATVLIVILLGIWVCDPAAYEEAKPAPQECICVDVGVDVSEPDVGVPKCGFTAEAI